MKEHVDQPDETSEFNINLNDLDQDHINLTAVLLDQKQKLTSVFDSASKKFFTQNKNIPV